MFIPNLLSADSGGEISLRARIVIVEDEPDLRDAVAEYLGANGYRRDVRRRTPLPCASWSSTRSSSSPSWTSPCPARTGCRLAAGCVRRCRSASSIATAAGTVDRPHRRARDSAPTTTSSSPTNCASCWRGCAACCAACRSPAESRIARRWPAEPDAPRRRIFFGDFRADLDGRMVTGRGGRPRPGQERIRRARGFSDALEPAAEPRHDLRSDRLDRGSRESRAPSTSASCGSERRSRKTRAIRNSCAPCAAKAISSRCPAGRPLSAGSAARASEATEPQALARHRAVAEQQSGARQDEPCRSPPRGSCGGCTRRSTGSARSTRSSNCWRARSSSHRAILFRLRELPGQGLAQSIAAYWVDEEAVGHCRPADASSCSRSSIPIRCSGGSPRRSGRARCSPVAPARSKASCARISRTRRSSPSCPSRFSPTAICGVRWPSTTASSSALDRRREGRAGDRRAGDRRRDRALAVGRPCQRDHPPDHAAGVARRHHRHRRDRQRSSSSTRPPSASTAFQAPTSSARTCSTRSSRTSTARATRPAPTTWPGAARR